LLSGGGYAQYAAVHKNHIIKIPEDTDIPLENFAAIPEAWLTAYQLL